MRPLLRLALITLTLSLFAALARAQPAVEPRTYLPQVANGPPPTVIARLNMVAILAVSVRAADDPAYSQQVLLRNETANSIYLAGWTIRNALKPEIAPFVFPAYEIPAGRTIAVISGTGASRPDQHLFFWGVNAPIWRTGDVAELYAVDGQRINWLVVPPLSLLPPVTTTPAGSPTATLTPSNAVRIIDVVKRDPAFPDESEEYVQIRNVSDEAIDIIGWRLINASRAGQVSPFVFPGFTLESDVTIGVFSTSGENDLEIGDFFWGQSDDIWNVGDRAELRDAQDRLISSILVPNQ